MFTASCGTRLDHGVLTVGYGSEAGTSIVVALVSDEVGHEHKVLWRRGGVGKSRHKPPSHAPLDPASSHMLVSSYTSFSSCHRLTNARDGSSASAGRDSGGLFWFFFLGRREGRLAGWFFFWGGGRGGWRVGFFFWGEEEEEGRGERRVGGFLFGFVVFFLVLGVFEFFVCVFFGFFLRVF